MTQLKLSLCVMLLALIHAARAQVQSGDSIRVQATIVDTFTSEPIPYASVYLKDKSRGTISDASGNFELGNISASDTICISFIGYAEKQFTLRTSIADTIFYIYPKRELLNEVTIYSSSDFLYELITRISKSQQHQTDTAKSYYSLKTNIDGKMVELLECYYNGIYNDYDVSELQLKNGRLALTDFQKRYFLSSETSRVMYSHKLFSQSTFLPYNPLSYNRRKLKRQYDLSLLSKYREDSAMIYVISYTPKSDEGEHFSGTIWVDSVSNTLRKITLDIKNASQHPFLPHGHTDSLIIVDIHISRTYDAARLKSIDFDYRLTYSTIDNKQFTAQTNAVLYAYNYDDVFKLPFFRFSEASFEDYRKISAAPYNAFFWKHQNEFSMAKGKKEKEYFINHQSRYSSRSLFSQKAFFGRTFFEHPYVQWNTQRVVFAEDHYDPTKYYGAMAIDRYRLVAQIYLDVNQSGDSTNFLTSTIFDPFESYYHYPASTDGQAFINMYFDLVEIYRRKLEQALAESDKTIASINSIYNDVNQQMEAATRQFFKDVDHGTNRNEMKKWNAYIFEELQINNLELFGLEY